MQVVALAVVGLALWAVLWSVVRPRAGYDTLWYAMYTYQDAGATVPESWDRSWNLVVEYADPSLVALLHRSPTGDWWGGWNDPMRQRWIGIYKMRPLMPLVGAVAYPVLGTSAPLAASAAAFILVLLAAGLVLAPLAGWLVTAVFLLLTAANPLIARWLIFLTTDGLGIALWFLALAFLARHANDGRQRWVAGATAAALLLAFTRPSAVALPVTLIICTSFSFLARRGPWRRFALAAALTTVPIVIFAIYAAALGLPSFLDQLQDVPTLHFSKPDIADPIGFLVARDMSVARSLVRSLPAQPQIWLGLLGAGIGFLLTRQWWTAPFLAAAVTVLLLLAAHPVLTEADRTLSPIWISLNLGLALLATAGVARMSSMTKARRAASIRRP